MKIDGLREISIYHEYFSEIENAFLRDIESGITITIEEFDRAADAVASFRAGREAIDPPHHPDYDEPA